MARKLNAISIEERELIYQEVISSSAPRHQIAEKHDISLRSLYNLRSRHRRGQQQGSSANFVEVTASVNKERCSALADLQGANFEFKEYSIELRGKFPHKLLLDILQISPEEQDV